MRLSLCLACLALTFPLAGCGGETSEGDVPDQLERLDVRMRAATGNTYDAVTRQGTLRVSGKERDFSLTVEGGEPLTVDVHSPGISNLSALEGGEELVGLKSVKEMGEEKGDVPLPENESIDPKNVKMLRHGLRKHQVREGVF